MSHLRHQGRQSECGQQEPETETEFFMIMSFLWPADGKLIIKEKRGLGRKRWRLVSEDLIMLRFQMLNEGKKVVFSQKDPRTKTLENYLNFIRNKKFDHFLDIRLFLIWFVDTLD